jgi:hypothetical protein
MVAALYRCFGLGLLACVSGCAMCGNCDDFTYGGYGGRWERLDPCYGRVGSAFTPEVGALVPYDNAPGSNANQNEEVKAPEPQPADAQPNEPQPYDLSPGETPPGDAPQGDATTAEDSAPMPPGSLSENGDKSTDSSVLRQPPRPLR